MIWVWVCVVSSFFIEAPVDFVAYQSESADFYLTAICLQPGPATSIVKAVKPLNQSALS